MKKEFRKSMSKFLTIAFSLSLVFSSSSKVGAQTQENMALSTEQIASMQSQLKELASEDKRKIGLHEEDPEEVIRIIVELEEKPAAERMPQGIAASTEIINEVKEAQKETKDEAEKLEGAEIRHSYGNLVNGFSMNVKRKEIEDLKKQVYETSSNILNDNKIAYEYVSYMYDIIFEFDKKYSKLNFYSII